MMCYYNVSRSPAHQNLMVRKDYLLQAYDMFCTMKYECGVSNITVNSELLIHLFEYTFSNGIDIEEFVQEGDYTPGKVLNVMMGDNETLLTAVRMHLDLATASIANFDDMNALFPIIEEALNIALLAKRPTRISSVLSNRRKISRSFSRSQDDGDRDDGSFQLRDFSATFFRTM